MKNRLVRCMTVPRKSKLLRCLIVLASALVLVDSQAQNILTNGSFEFPNTNGTSSLGYAYVPGGSTFIPGWTTLLNGVEYGDPSRSDGVIPIYLGVAQNGSYYIDLAPLNFTGGGIQQTFPSVIGQNYEVSFYMGNLVYAGRDGIGTLVASAANTTNAFAMTNLTGYVQYGGRSFVFTAVSNTTTLAFRCYDNAQLHFSALDNVSVVPQGTNFTLAISLYPGIQIGGVTGQTYVVQYAQPPATNLNQLQYVTLPTLSNMVYDVSSPGAITRSYRAFQFLTNQMLGAEVAATVIGLTPGITIHGTAGKTYTILHSGSLPTTNWLPLSDITLTTSSGRVFDPGSRGIATRFYWGRTPF
ncbi:MAG: DUF642 domain-containing protein [Akkermansiaceae bacterium]|nr:DUF642 domain-containing protein [Verrucomicrobiales bacterium]